MKSKISERNYHNSRDFSNMEEFLLIIYKFNHYSFDLWKLFYQIYAIEHLLIIKPQILKEKFVYLIFMKAQKWLNIIITNFVIDITG